MAVAQLAQTMRVRCGDGYRRGRNGRHRTDGGARRGMMRFIGQHDGGFGRQPAGVVFDRRRRAGNVRDRGNVVPVDAVADAERHRGAENADGAADSDGQERDAEK